MLGRALQWVIAVALAALVTRAAQSLSLPSPDTTFVGGATAVTIGVLVGWAASRVMTLPKVATGLGTTLFLAIWTAVVVMVSLAVGGLVFAIGQRAFCGGWPSLEHLVSRDLITLFGLPAAAVLLASGPLQWPHADSDFRRYSEPKDTEPRDQASAGHIALALAMRVADAVALLIDVVAHLIRVVGFPLLAGAAVVLFVLQVEDFAGRWPAVLGCRT